MLPISKNYLETLYPYGKLAGNFTGSNSIIFVKDLIR